MNTVLLPYIGIERIKKFIKEIPKDSCSLNDLINKFGKSNVSNALPALILLKLVEYDKRKKTVSLSDVGRKFRTALIAEDDKKAREIIKNVIDNLELFIFIKGLLERKGLMRSEEIGKEIAFKYNKTWRDIATYRAYGSACASILSFAGYGIYGRGILKKEEYAERKEKKLPSPYLSFNKIIKILREVGNGEIDLHLLSERLKTRPNRLGAELSVCVELGLIRRLVPGKFMLTKKGKDLIDPLNTHIRGEIWKDVLIKSNYNKIIALLNNIEFDFKKLCEILQHHFGGKWKEEKTIVTFTKKFLNWLKEANLIEEKKGKYKLTENVKISNDSFEKKTSLLGITVTDYYFIGKNIGIILASNNIDEIKKAISNLISLCKQDASLVDVIELLEQHLKLFNEMKLSDGRIFIPDIKLLEKKLKIGVKNGD